MPEWLSRLIVTVIGIAEEMPIRIVVVIVLGVNGSLKTIFTAISSKLHITWKNRTTYAQKVRIFIFKK